MQICYNNNNNNNNNTLVSPTNETDRHDITEIVLKVALNTKALTLSLIIPQ
jgi:YbbR domain-containing protein